MLKGVIDKEHVRQKVRPDLRDDVVGELQRCDAGVALQRIAEDARAHIVVVALGQVLVKLEGHEVRVVGADRRNELFEIEGLAVQHQGPVQLDQHVVRGAVASQVQLRQVIVMLCQHLVHQTMKGRVCLPRGRQ